MDDLSDLEAAFQSKKKSKSGSLRRALSWLRLSGRKKKKSKSEGDKPTSKQRKDSQGSVASKLDEESKWSVHYKPAQYEHQQENVFLPSTRPPHIEDLHKQAEIGLKSLQEQGNLDGYSHLRNGRDCGDDCNQHSRDEDVPHVNKSGSCAPSDEVWAKTRSLPPPTPDEIRRDLLSARSGAIPTGTTFKPQGHQKTQSSFKGPKLKEKRIRRTTIMGLPQHVQQELGFGKASHLSNTSVKVPGADSAGVVSASRGDGSRCFNNVSHSRARGSLRSVNFTASSEGDNESISTLEINDQPNWELIDFSKRPKSLAIPKSSIPSELLQSPVMSMSPQATYLSKIIPNAILPAAVDVVMINTSQNCLRTLSRNSLLCAPSPACSRSNSLQNYDGKDYASSDAWSHSQSSETIVSNNSTISSQGNALNNNSAEKDREKLRDEHNLTNSAPDHRANTSRWVSTCSAQNASQITEDTPAHTVSNGYSDQALSPAQSTNSIVDVSDTQSVTSERSISRSLSVRKMKKPPAPPIRMHSLQAEEQNSELKDPSCASPGEDDVFSPSLGEMNSIRFESCVDSPAAASPLVNHKLVTPKDGMGEMSKGSILHSTNNFPAQNPTSPIKSERTMSPSSGYSSQSGTPTLVRNLVSPSPPVGRSKPRTPERSSSLLSQEMSQSSSLASISSSVSEHVDLFVIPPPPSSPAPPPPTINIAKLPTLLSYTWGAAAIPPPPAGPAPLPPTKKTSLLFAAATVAPPVTTTAASTVAPPVTTTAASTVAPPVTTTAASTVAPPVTTMAASPPAAGTLAAVVLASALAPVAQHVTSTSADTSDSSAPPEQVQQKLIPLPMKLPSPPPSPPPSHHPPPPPKKTTGKIVPQSSSTVFEPTKQELSMLNWPPPPPPLSPSVFTPSMSSSSTSEKVNVSHSGKQDAEFLFPPPPPPSLLADTAQEKRSSAEDLQPLSPPAPPPLPPASTLKNTIPEQPVAAASSLPSLPLSQPAETKLSYVPKSSLSLASSPATCTSQHLQEKPLVSGIPPTVREDSQLPKIMTQTPKASNEDSEKELTVQSSPNQDSGGQASVPVVTPSLLQMVRLRSVQMSTYGPGVPDSQQPVNKNQLDLKPPTKSNVTAPSKPARKSLSLRLSSSSDSESSIKPNHSPHIKKPATTATTDVQGQTMLKPSDDGAPHKSPASTASFIFSKNVSSRKLVFETPRSPEAEAAMKKNFMAELNSVSERIASKTESKNSTSLQSKAVSEVPFAQKKPGRIPPPVAKKPLFLPNAHRLPSTSTDVRDLREAQDKSDALEATSDAKDEKGKLESGNGQLALCKGD